MGRENWQSIVSDSSLLYDALRKRELIPPRARAQASCVSRARAEASRRAAEFEELKTAKVELERERNNLYKRVAVVEKKLERGTHHKDGQKRHDRSQTAIAVRSFLSVPGLTHSFAAV